VDTDELRGLRAAAQRLDAGRGAASAHQVVHEMVALQAQDLAAATFGVAVRADDLRAAAVDYARNVERSIVRLWCLRGTLHLVAAEDVRWLLDLVRPRLAIANRRRRAELGLDEAATARGVHLIAESLHAEGPLTRAELAERLKRNGLAWEGQATIHVIWRAAIDGLVCFGPDREGQETFVALDDWVRASTQRHPVDPVIELARRYIRAFGPATADGFAAWSGLPGAEVRRVWTEPGAMQAAAVSTPYGEMLVASDQRPLSAPVTRLLPAFDAVWVGYRNHEPLIEQAFVRQVFPGGGVIRPMVFGANRTMGTWVRRGSEVRMTMFDGSEEGELEAAVLELGRIYSREFRVSRRR
jgi:winged helix DNA-binding protein